LAASLSARKRRSAARSARHHAAIERRRINRSRILALLFLVRLRRRVRLRRNLDDLEELSLVRPSAVELVCVIV